MKRIVCTVCHRYRLNSAGVLVSRDIVRTVAVCYMFLLNKRVDQNNSTLFGAHVY